ncbi:hypothetical protein ACFY4C_29645 [Actinomadura viridis]|uniref:hypothetical protein n=1 Tax=Actinomadura viridis TaxID=58110 RepID=UPI0036C1856A
MLRLHDHRTGQALDVPPYALHVHVHAGRERALVTADLLRRVAERTRRRAALSRAEEVRPGAGFADLNLPDVPVVAPEDVPAHAVWVGSEDVPGRQCLIVPPEDRPWAAPAGSAGADPLSVRLAILRERYRDPVAPDDGRVAEAVRDLARWRSAVAGWARHPGRPMDRAYAAEGQAALIDDLDSPAALAVLDRLAEDPEVAPGAKVETVIHLDLLLGLDLVADIGRG